MKRIAAQLICLAFVAVGVVMPATGAAQGDVRNRIIPNVTFENSDVRDALKVLFRAVDVSYSVASDVQGFVTSNLKDIPFETALRNILNQVDATYRIEGNIYNIIRKPVENPVVNPLETPGGVAQRTEPIQKIRLKVIDPAVLIAILSGNANPFTLSPEMSSYPTGGMGGGGGGFGGGGGIGGGGGGFGGGGFGGGGGIGGGGGGFGGGGFGGGGGGFGGGGGGFGGGGGRGF